MERAANTARRARRSKRPLESHPLTTEPPRAKLRARAGTPDAQLATREPRPATAAPRPGRLRARRLAPERHLPKAAPRPAPAARPPATAAPRLVTVAPRLVTVAPSPARLRIRPGTLETRPATAAPRPARARSRRVGRGRSSPGIVRSENRKGRICGPFTYRGDRTRTCNPRFWRPVLYQIELRPWALRL
jgi:hypothetical protein